MTFGLVFIKLFNKSPDYIIQKMTTNFFIYIAILFIPLYSIHFSLFKIPFNVWEILVLIAVITWILDFCFKKESRKNNLEKISFLLKKFGIAFLLLAIGLFLSLFKSENYLISWGIIKGWFFFPFLLGILVFLKTYDRRDIENFIKFLFFSISAVAVIALFYLLAGKLTYDKRLTAFYFSPNYLAMYLSPGLIIGLFNLWKLASVFQEEQKLKNRSLFFIYQFLFRIKNWPLIIGNFLLIIILYFTYSYAAWITTLVILSGLYLIFSVNKKKFVFFLGTLLVIGNLLFVFQYKNPKFQSLANFDERSSLASRIMIWQSAIKILKDNWLLGIGPGTFQKKYTEYQKFFPPYLEWSAPQPHNIYLAFWLQSGLLGLLGFLLLVFSWLKNIANLKSYEEKILIAPLAGVMFYFLIHGLADTPYWKNDLAAIFWLIFFLGMNLFFLKNQKA